MTHPPASHRSLAFYQALPKVELHRHLEGSLRLETLVEIARDLGMDLAQPGRLAPLVQVAGDEPYTSQSFLSKFETLRLFYRTPEIIARMAREAVEDARADNVCYLELRFTPVALSRAQGFPLGEVMDWVIAGVQQAGEGIMTRLIVSINRHEPPRLAEQAIRLAVEHIRQGIVGIDVAGNESAHPQLGAFAGMLREARQAGLGLTIHAGEWGGAENVAEAIRRYQADRIGHGVRVMEDPSAVDIAHETGVPFEVCLTSNIQSGVVSGLDQHPLERMLQAGLNLTLNTDDPSISQITLSREHYLACEMLGIPILAYRRCMLRGAGAAFLNAIERAELVQKLVDEFNSLTAITQLPRAALDS